MEDDDSSGFLVPSFEEPGSNGDAQPSGQSEPGAGPDQHGVFQVHVTGDVVDQVTVHRSWEQHYPEPRSFCAALTSTILAALAPAADSSRSASQAPARRSSDSGLTPGEPERWNSFWNEFSLWERKLEKCRERALAGHLPEWQPPAAIDDPEMRWVIDFDSAGRFRMIGLAPQVFERATASKLSNLISNALRDVHLDQSRPVDPELLEIDEHRVRFEKYLAG